MQSTVSKIEETINQLISNIEYLNEHISSAESLSHSILPMQRKIKELNKQIKVERGQSPQNKPYISHLCEQEYELQSQLNTVSSIESRLPDLMESMTSFLSSHNYRRKRLTELSAKELYVLNNLYQLSIPKSVSKGRAVLQSYLSEVSDDALIQLLNSKFQLRGYKRFYFDEGKVASKYCEDLKSVLNQILDKNSFRDLVDIIKAKHPDNKKQLRPIDVLKTVIGHYNKRQV